MRLIKQKNVHHFSFVLYSYKVSGSHRVLSAGRLSDIRSAKCEMLLLLTKYQA